MNTKMNTKIEELNLNIGELKRMLPITERNIQKRARIMANWESGGIFSTGDVKTIVCSLLDWVSSDSMSDNNYGIQQAITLINQCVEEGIVEPSHWNEALKFPLAGFKCGLSFKWVNYYVGKSCLRVEGWEEVQRCLHILCASHQQVFEYFENLVSSQVDSSSSL